jgi:hypothetical protein
MFKTNKKIIIEIKTIKLVIIGKKPFILNFFKLNIKLEIIMVISPIMLDNKNFGYRNKFFKNILILTLNLKNFKYLEILFNLTLYQ